MPKQCQSCGMPLEQIADFAGGDDNADFCVHCVNADGTVKTCEEIFEGGVQFFLGAIGGEQAAAERITRKNMLMQPHWQDNDCAVLKGETATDKEFAEALGKL